jgi:NAD:arginine ADP-ribosyltransferase
VNCSDDVLDGYVPGQKVTEHAFTSTSRDPGVAQGAFDGNTLMVVGGKNGRDIAPFSGYPEAKILYDGGTPFQVVSKTWQADIGKWVVTLQEAS